MSFPPTSNFYYLGGLLLQCAPHARREYPGNGLGIIAADQTDRHSIPQLAPLYERGPPVAARGERLTPLDQPRKTKYIPDRETTLGMCAASMTPNAPPDVTADLERLGTDGFVI